MRRRIARSLGPCALLLACVLPPWRVRADAPSATAPERAEIASAAIAPATPPPPSRAELRHLHRSAPRVPGFSYELGARAFLGEAQGALANVRLTYRPERRRLALELGVEPVGWATDGQHPLGIFAGRMSLGFDSDDWALGASVGALYARINDDTRWAKGYGATFGVGGRIGAVDGAHFAARADLVLVENRASGALVWLEGQIPTAGPWIRVTVSGGSTGSFYLDLGVRVQITEARSDGAIFLTPSIGVGEVFDPVEVVDHYGVLLGLTLEHRP